jgi:hypothetical protein
MFSKDNVENAERTTCGLTAKIKEIREQNGRVF